MAYAILSFLPLLYESQDEKRLPSDQRDVVKHDSWQRGGWEFEDVSLLKFHPHPHIVVVRSDGSAGFYRILVYLDRVWLELDEW